MWEPEGTLEAPLAHAATVPLSAPILRSGWTVDTFANVFVVPENAVAILHVYNTKSRLETSGGIVEARWALLDTPVGQRRGLIARDSPRLMPGCALDTLHVDWKRNAASATAGNRELLCGVFNKHPVCTNPACVAHRTNAPENAAEESPGEVLPPDVTKTPQEVEETVRPASQEPSDQTSPGTSDARTENASPGTIRKMVP